MKKIVILCVVLGALVPGALLAQVEPPRGPVYVSEPVVPTLSPVVRNLPDDAFNPNLYGMEMKRREDYGFFPIPYDIEPKNDPLLMLDKSAAPPQPSGFETLLHNYAGMTSPSSPPDDTGDVGTTYFLQGINGSGSYSTSTIGVYNKATGANAKTFSLQSLASGSPCNSGYCDPIVLYDRMADRWLVSEFPSSGGHLCVYVSQTSDPTGAWYYYYFANVESGTPDYPKYGVWPQNGNGGSYFVGINASKTSGKRDVVALDRAKMLAGQAATYQTFTVNTLPNSGFQLVLPATVQGRTAPPNGTPAIVMRPRDDEAQDGASTSYDLLEMWAVSVDWTTPANSTITQLTSLHMADYDMTLCGMGSTWNCMPQAGTSQKIDPIREPVHFPLVYRNFGDHEALVGCFVADTDGTDHSGLRWFEVRKTAGTWSLFQEGLVGGEANVHRSIGSTAIDSSGNIAMGYTRTGTSLYPSIYYKGRLATDTLGTMPQGEYVIKDATTSKTDNERYGDYAGIGVDPVDDCTFWFTTEYGGSGQTQIAAFKFDACGCLAVPAAPVASATAPQANRIAVSWNDSATASITRYWVYRATVSGGPYTQIATVNDTSPGVGGGAGYTYNDDTVSGGTRYYYVVKSNDSAACTSAASTEVNALATGVCTLAPAFAGLSTVTNPAGATCTLNLAWSAGTAACSGPLRYNVYRSTTSGFTPAPANRIAQDLNATSYSDLDNLVSGTTYYYIVRAVDSSNSAEETNTSERSGKPTGAYADGTWTAGAESGDPTMTLPSPWTSSTTYKRTGTYSYSTGATYPTSVCSALTTPSLVLGTGSALSYYHIYSTESGYDGGRVEISTNGGSSWTALTPTPAYGGTITSSGNSCSWATSTACYIGTSTGYPTTWQTASISLSAYNGQTVLLRWNFTTDSSGAGTGSNPGWYIDDIQITHVQVPGSCATGSACANNPSLVDVTPNGPLTLCAGTAQLLTATPTGGSGNTFQWYDGASPIGGATSSTYSASATGTHSYNCKVSGTGCGTGMMDGSSVTITWQSAPTFAGLSSVTNPQSATCTLNLAWSAASSPCAGTMTYKVYRSTTTPVSTIPANVVASGVTATSLSDASSLTNGTTYYYVVHAVDGAGQEDANTVEFAGVPTGTISGSNLLTESFDGTTFPPTGWTATVVGSSSTPAAWARVTTSTNPTGISPHTGAAMAELNSYHAQAGGSNRLARTATFNIAAGTTSATATLWVYHETGYTGNADQIQVQTSPDGTTWTTRGTVNRYDGTTGWKQHTVNLSALIGAGNFRIGYLGVSAYGNDTYMDDVSIDVTTAVSCAAGTSVPGETSPGDLLTTAQTWTDKTTHGWTANAQATGYKVVLGTPSQLPYLLNSTTDSCVKWTGAGTSCTLSDTPAAGSFYWFLVIGTNGSGDGSPGNATAGLRVLNSTTGTCP